MKTIYWKQNCPHCKNAKELMDRKGDTYITKEIGTEISLDDFKEAFPNVRTAPLIIESDGTIIGGYQDLVKYYDSNEKRSVWWSGN
jgi:glutaredoxin